MKPWSVIVCDKTPMNMAVFRRRENETGIMYVNREQNEVMHPMDHNGLERDRHVHLFDDEGTCDQFIEWYSKEYPGAVLLKSKSVQAIYRDFGPIKKGLFTEKGMIPE